MNIPAFYRLLTIFKPYIYSLFNLQYYSIVDLQGRIGTDGEKIYIDSYYAKGLHPTSQRGGWRLVYKSSQAKSGHNGVTIHSPTVPWDGTQAGLAAYHAKTGETDAAGSGCWVLETDNITVEKAGAVGDKIIDDAGAFQHAATVLGNDGGGTLKFSGSHLIDDNLTLPSYVSLLGPIGSPDEIKPSISADYLQKNGLLKVNPAKTITVGDGAEIGRCLIINKNINLPCLDAAELTAAIAAFSGTAITLNTNYEGSGAYCHNLLIIGFEYAIYSILNPRIKCEFVFGDCTNGIHLEQVFDVSYVSNCHFWPYISQSVAFATYPELFIRSGVAFSFTNSNDWTKVTDCFEYGYAVGFTLDSCSDMHLAGVAADYPSALSTSAIGIKIYGCDKAVIDTPIVSQYGTGIHIENNLGVTTGIGGNNYVRLIAPTVFNSDVKNIYLKSGRTIITEGYISASPIGIDLESPQGAVIIGNHLKNNTVQIKNSGGSATLLKSTIKTNTFEDVDDTLGEYQTSYRMSSARNEYVFNGSGVGVEYKYRYARGTPDAPTISQDADIPFRLIGQVHDGVDFRNIASIRAQAQGAPSAGNTRGQLILSTVPTGSTTLVDRIAIFGSGNLVPLVDNAYSFGITGNRWTEVWAANGTIQTSDERTKTNIQDASLGLDFINALRPVSYKWIEGGNEVIRQVYLDKDGNEIPEGEPIPNDAIPGRIITEARQGYRTHWGLIAQEVKAAVDSAGVDFGGWVLTDKDDPESQQALRYDQFISPLIKAVQELSAEVESLKRQLH